MILPISFAAKACPRRTQVSVRNLRECVSTPPTPARDHGYTRMCEVLPVRGVDDSFPCVPCVVTFDNVFAPVVQVAVTKQKSLAAQA
jgi:hypothetical protein